MSNESTPTPNTPPSNKPDAGTYELAPPEPPPVAKPPTLLDGFDEDADFSRDPEVEAKSKEPRGGRNVGRSRVLPTKPAKSEDASVDLGPALARQGRLTLRVLAVVGWLLCLGAVAAAAHYAEARWYASALFVFYATLLHTLTGVAAVGAAGYLSARPIGRFDLAAARMFVAVGAFQLVSSIKMPWIAGTTDSYLSAGLLYFALVVSLFRLRPGQAFVVAGAHAGMALVFTLGQWLATWAAMPIATP